MLVHVVLQREVLAIRKEQKTVEVQNSQDLNLGDNSVAPSVALPEKPVEVTDPLELMSSIILSPSTLKSATLLTPVSQISEETFAMATLAPQEQVQQRTVEQVVNVAVEMRSGYFRGNWGLSSAANTVGAKRFHCPDVLFQPCTKIHDTSFRSVMKFYIDYQSGYVFRRRQGLKLGEHIADPTSPLRFRSSLTRTLWTSLLCTRQSSGDSESTQNRGGPTRPAHGQDRRCHVRVATTNTDQPDSTEGGGGAHSPR